VYTATPLFFNAPTPRSKHNKQQGLDAVIASRSVFALSGVYYNDYGN
jgi:hypothetical protein